jgi:hypothetical protein
VVVEDRNELEGQTWLRVPYLISSRIGSLAWVPLFLKLLPSTLTLRVSRSTSRAPLTLGSEEFLNEVLWVPRGDFEHNGVVKPERWLDSERPT